MHSVLRLGVRRAIVAAVAVVLVVTVVALTLVGSRTSRSALTQQADAYAGEVAQASQGAVKAEVADALQLAEATAVSLQALRRSGIRDRAVADRLLRDQLEAHPNLLGAWTAWEPDAFDGRDREYAGTAGTDATGRYVPYWNRAGGTVSLDPLVDYETPGAGDYYLVSKNTRKTKVLDPYVYPIDGQDVLMTSVVAPIVEDGRFLGVAGYDIALDTLQAALATVKPLGGYVSVVSTNGSVVASPVAAQVANLRPRPWPPSPSGPAVAGRR